MTPPVRLTIRPRYVAETLGFFCLLAGLPLVLGLPVVFPKEVVLILVVVSVVGVVVLGRVLTTCHQWVELDNGVLRGRKLLTRRMTEWRVSDIVSVRGMSPEDFGLARAAGEKGSRAYDVEFRDGTTLLLSRYEMDGMDSFLEALAEQIRRDYVPLPRGLRNGADDDDGRPPNA